MVDFNNIELNDTAYNLNTFQHTWTFRMRCWHGSIFTAVNNSFLEITDPVDITVNTKYLIINVTATDTVDRLVDYWFPLVLSKIKKACAFANYIPVTIIADDMVFDFNPGKLVENCKEAVNSHFTLTFKNAHIRNLEYTAPISLYTNDTLRFTYDHCKIDYIIMTQQNGSLYSQITLHKKTKIGEVDYLMSDGGMYTSVGKLLRYNNTLFHISD